MKVEVAILGSTTLINLMVSVDVKQNWNLVIVRVQELCEQGSLQFLWT